MTNLNFPRFDGESTWSPLNLPFWESSLVLTLHLFRSPRLTIQVIFLLVHPIIYLNRFYTHKISSWNIPIKGLVVYYIHLIYPHSHTFAANHPTIERRQTAQSMTYQVWDPSSFLGFWVWRSDPIPAEKHQKNMVVSWGLILPWRRVINGGWESSW